MWRSVRLAWLRPMTHTPGPWTARDIGGVSDIRDPNHHHVEDWAVYAGSHLVADVPWDERDAANARLIAAAPDLLKALRDLVPLIEGEYPEQARVWLFPALEAIERAMPS